LYGAIFIIENVWETIKMSNMTDLFLFHILINWTRENVFDAKKRFIKNKILHKNMPYLCFLHTFLR